jgi:hypothetical protein
MNLPLFATVPAWMSALALVLSIALPATLWHAFYSTGVHARIVGARTMSLWLGVLMLVWVVGAVILSLEGVFEADPTARIPNLSGAFLPLAGGFIVWTASRSFRQTVRAMPADWMIRIQFYRALGFIYVVGWRLGSMPAPYAIPAGFGDLVVGFSALWVARMVRLQRPGARAAAIGWNIFGLTDVVTASGSGQGQSGHRDHVIPAGAAAGDRCTALRALPFLLTAPGNRAGSTRRVHDGLKSG